MRIVINIIFCGMFRAISTESTHEMDRTPKPDLACPCARLATSISTVTEVPTRKCYKKKLLSIIFILADFAVGAPYDGLNGRGAVYIYHGSIDGVREKHSQVIMAEEVGRAIGKSLETFGFSISGGMDLDGNDYPDMAIGSYLSDTAFFFR